MRVTRSSMTSVATSRGRRSETSHKVGKVAKLPKPSLPAKQQVKKLNTTRKRKCRSLPVATQGSENEIADDDDDDIQSMHSECDLDVDIPFIYTCFKCDCKFSRKSYLETHFKLAHKISLGALGSTQKKENGFEISEESIKTEITLQKEVEGAKIEDEDYFSGDSLVDSASLAITPDASDMDSDVDVEIMLDDYIQCHHCGCPFEHQLHLENHSCVMRNLSPEHMDIVKNQPFVELKRLKGPSKKMLNRLRKFPHACPICSVRFTTNVDMMIHAQMEHRVDPNLMKFASNNCSPGQDQSTKFLPGSKNGVYQRDCVRKSKGRKNDLTDASAEKLACPYCQKTHATKNKLDAHLEKEHPGKEVKKYDHNGDPLSKALSKQYSLGKGDPKKRVSALMRMMGLALQTDSKKFV